MMSDALIAGGLFSALLAAIVATSFSRSPRWATSMRAVRPARHVGATVGYGRVLARMGRDLPSEDLRTVPEQMAADHGSFVEIPAAIDRFDATIEAALDVFLRAQPRVRMRLAAGAAQTGELDRAELERLLAADDDELAGVTA